MIKATCIEKLRDKNGTIKGYVLQDCNGVQMKFNSEQVKQAIFLQQLTVTNLKLTSDGRLIDNNDSTKPMEKPYTNVDTHNVHSAQGTSKTEQCINKIKNMTCCEWAQLTPDKLAKLIEILSDCKLKKLEFTKEDIYYVHNIPLYIETVEYKNCPDHIESQLSKYSLSEKIEYCKNTCKHKNAEVWTSISFPIQDEANKSLELAKYGDNEYNEFNAFTNDALIKLLSMWKNIPQCKISYGDISYALYELMLKYVDTKYATVNNVLKLDVLTFGSYADEYEGVESFALEFSISYSEKVIIPSWRRSMLDDDKITAYIVDAVLYVTKEGYTIKLFSYNHKIVDNRGYYGFHMDSDKCEASEITIGFNDDLKQNIKKVKLLIDGIFKSSLKETKDLAKVMKNKATH